MKKQKNGVNDEFKEVHSIKSRVEERIRVLKTNPDEFEKLEAEIRNVLLCV